VGVVLGFHIVDGDALMDLVTRSDPMPTEVKNRQNLDAQAISKARSDDWQQSVAFSNCVQRHFQIEMNERSIDILDQSVVSQMQPDERIHSESGIQLRHRRYPFAFAIANTDMCLQRKWQFIIDHRLGNLQGLTGQ
jgi:hypothetical protein